MTPVGHIKNPIHKNNPLLVNVINLIKDLQQTIFSFLFHFVM